MEIRNYGFNPDEVEILEENWKFGARSERIILQRDGQWRNMPKFEHQAKDYETFGCTVYGGTSQMEILFKRMFGFEPNYSDRYIYNLAEINPPGANPQKAYEAIRKQGVIDEAILPRSATLEEYVTPRPMSDKYLNMGLKWLDRWEFSHEWVASRDKSRMKGKIIDALKYSPVAISVTAWYKENGVYVDRGQRNTHWGVCIGYEVREDGIYLKFFDSYGEGEEFIKILHKDHVTSFAKRITIKKKEEIIPYWKKLWNKLFG